MSDFRLHFAILFTLLGSVAAQQSPPVFRTSSDLVLVPVVAMQHGDAVRGLTKDDFVIFRDGTREEIAVFEEVDRTSPSSPVRLPPHTVQNYVSEDWHQDLVVVALDFTSGTWSANNLIKAYVRDILLELAAAGTPTSVVLMTESGAVQVHSFTDAPANLSTIVNRFAPVTG